MKSVRLIETLLIGEDEHPTHKYEIYGSDSQTPEYALLFERQATGSGGWVESEERISLAVEQEKQEASSVMDYGYSDSAAALRDLVSDAITRCEEHWQESQHPGENERH
ncbi:hypothetical protein CYR40_20610 [Chimaeribacter arupi]|uniref:Uncharacterized protein n=2 Tax=Yersiniaceae TaxID=1903411 RepID=A0A2N5EIC4_9GAMM|nr:MULTISPECIES: hypothetical protein [Yersiniaceae]MBS0969323.1 hypothetical protein [Nissabacter archeti]MDV5140363.1 hypothetical protein [Chimaeribacter arupi]PLR32793.1 hypothetical protein CYR23_13900 [Chimaeribacter arupi]PLR42423.1 hypothetical protein CYR40_20610 [Chimaeribacter arupi]PLR44386.1 hypothetical protein CYR34_19245 [Chimaeribacter arupi]